MRLRLRPRRQALQDRPRFSVLDLHRFHPKTERAFGQIGRLAERLDERQELLERLEIHEDEVFFYDRNSDGSCEIMFLVRHQYARRLILDAAAAKKMSKYLAARKAPQR